MTLLCIIPQSVQAQKTKVPNLLLYDDQPYHFGFIIALNNMNYAFDYKSKYQNDLYGFLQQNDLADQDPIIINRVHESNFDTDTILFNTRSIEPNIRYGFTVGIVGNLRLGKYFDLRFIPSLSFGNKSINYTYNVIRSKYRNIIDWDFENAKITQATTSVFVTIIDLPIHIKYKSKRYNNIAAYIIAGGNPRFDLSPLWSDKKNLHNKIFDFAAEIGAGFDYYTGYFKMGIEAKFSFGLLDVLDKRNNQYDASIEGLKNRMFQLSLTFE